MVLKKSLVKKRSPIKTAFATSFIVSLAIFTTLFAMNIDLVTEFFGDNPTFRWIPQNIGNNPDDDNPSFSESFLEYIENTIFIGDSRTVGFVNYSYLKQENVYALNGQNQQAALYSRFVDLGTGSLLTAAQAVAITMPKRIIISYGINQMYSDQATFIKYYSELIDDLKAASPNSLIIIQSMLPVCYNYHIISGKPYLTNDNIDSYNVLLEQLAKDKGCKYLDTTPALKDEYNSLAPEFDSGDGLHFNPDAYKELLRYIEQHRVY